MSRRALASVAVLTVLVAGCLGGIEDPASDALSPDQAPQDANGSEDPDRSDQDEPGDDTGDGDDARDDRNRSSSGNRANRTDGSKGSPGDGSDEHPSWPDPSNASIRPGVRVAGDGQCTSNFLFRTPDNATLMLGVAAHCFDQSPSTVGSNGCSDDVEPMQPGAEVDIDPATQPGTLVYSSFWTLQQMDDPSAAACRDNDFALVAIDAADRGQVHPAVLEIGGPTGLAAGDAIGAGDGVEWFGNTALTPSSPATDRHEGTVVTSSDWSFQAYSATPGLPGDSGSGVMLEDGSAAGALVTVNTVFPGANGVTKLDPALAFAQQHADLDVELVTWRSFETGPLG